MSLSAEVKHKSEVLSQKGIELQRSLEGRIFAPKFRSYFVTFVLVPVFIGVAAGIIRAPGASFSHRLSRLILLGWRILPMMNLKKSELHR